MLRIIFFTISVVFFSHTAFALDIISGEGYAKTREEAKRRALAALSESLQVEVKSEVNLSEKNDVADVSQQVQTLSELPLLGVDFTFINRGHEVVCSGLLKPEKVKGLYTKQLELLASDINRMNGELKTVAREHRHSLLTDMLSKIGEYKRYQLVAHLLGVKKFPLITVSASQAKGQLLSIEASVPTLELAASLLTRNLPDEQIYVYPASPHGSYETTELGRVMRDKIRSKVKSHEDREQALFFMKGHYEIQKDGVLFTYRLVDTNGATEATRLVKVSKQAYSGIAYQSKSIDFNRLLHEGYVVSNRFHAELNSNRGKSDLLFTEGEDVELFARINRPGYFYIVVHNTTDNSSYLMELNEAAGNRKFVKYVNADQANRWISLGEFEVVAPFGVENLQLIASNKDMVDILPANAFDKSTELYMITAESTKDALIKTRGLKKKAGTEHQAVTSEASLTMTTMKK